MYTGFEKRDEHLDNLQKWRKNQPNRLWMSENGNAIECQVIPFEQAVYQHRMVVADIRWSKIELRNKIQQRNRFILSDYERKIYVTGMLYKLNLDTLERRRQHHMVKTFHKVFYGHDGINIPASIILSQRDNLKFVQPASRINCHLYSFYPRAIRFWNLLPFHLRNMNDMDAFGQSLAAAVVEKMSS